MFLNGKYTGGGMVANPFACINDGLVDIIWADHPDYESLMGIAQLLDQAKKGAGSQAYSGKCRYMRGRKIKMTFKGRPMAASTSHIKVWERLGKASSKSPKKSTGEEDEGVEEDEEEEVEVG